MAYPHVVCKCPDFTPPAGLKLQDPRPHFTAPNRQTLAAPRGLRPGGKPRSAEDLQQKLMKVYVRMQERSAPGFDGLTDVWSIFV